MGLAYQLDALHKAVEITLGGAVEADAAAWIHLARL